MSEYDAIVTETTISRLNKLTSEDVAASHSDADDILLAALILLGHREIAKAYIEAQERVGFHYA